MNHFSNCKRGINVHFNFYSCCVDYEFLLYNWSLFYFRKKRLALSWVINHKLTKLIYIPANFQKHIKTLTIFTKEKKHHTYFCWPPQLLVYISFSPFPKKTRGLPSSPGYLPPPTHLASTTHPPTQPRGGPPNGGNETTIFAVRGTQSPLDVMQDLCLGRWRGLGERRFFWMCNKNVGNLL